MYRLKHVPEDFIVEEMTDIEEKDDGAYLYAWMKKQNITTSDAIRRIARALKKDPREVSFAGTKDKKALTTQLISIKGLGKERLASIRLDNIHLTYYGRGDEPILLGMLKGNRFTIIIREITRKPIPLQKFINYFGEQRFGRFNAEIGKHLVRKEFKEAVSLLTGEWKNHAEEHLKSNPNDYVGILRSIPREISLMYVHAFQSRIWNSCAKRIAKETGDNVIVPIIGFGTELEDYPFTDILEDELAKEGISQRDFIIRQIPRFSCDGYERKLYVPINELNIGNLEPNDLGKDKKVKVGFWLEKGCYATVAISQIAPS